MGEQNDGVTSPLSSQRDNINKLILSLEQTDDPHKREDLLSGTFESAPDNIRPDSDAYYSVLNYYLYQYSLKHYKHLEERMCLWRFIKNLPKAQLDYEKEETNSSELHMMDRLIQVYFYSDPLDDLTCIFIPIDDDTPDNEVIMDYVEWIKRYFYEAKYPTSLLWLFALDTSLSSLFPEEIIYWGQRVDHSSNGDIPIPDFDYPDAVLIKRFSDEPIRYVKLEGDNANCEFQQILPYLQQEYQHRCISHSTKQDKTINQKVYQKEWEKFEDVLKFGVADTNESGCTSFSDLRASTEFLNAFGKEVYLNKVQQPFFGGTALISQRFAGRIDKFMGDNVMCVFLNNNMPGRSKEEKEIEAILNNLFAIFSLCQILNNIILKEEGFKNSNLGLRSGVTYGEQILRSNLGNEILRDFTVTGETVNLAARLEHISIPELIIHNQAYFEKAIARYPKIREILEIGGIDQILNSEAESDQILSPEAESDQILSPEAGNNQILNADEKNNRILNSASLDIIRKYTLYHNIISNLQELEKVKFDIRFNDRFYSKLREHLEKKYEKLLNKETSKIYGYEGFRVEGYELKFYFSYYNPKGFSDYKRIWILPLEGKLLKELDITKIKQL